MTLFWCRVESEPFCKNSSSVIYYLL